MKLHHFSFIFIIIALSLMLMADVKTDYLIAVADEKSRLDHCFEKAVDDAAKNLVQSEGIEGLKVNRERAVEEFFLSLYAAMDIINNPEKQDLIKNYIPVIVITTNEGYYIYYSDEYRKSIYIDKRWSELLPYYYEDNDFIYSFTLNDIVTLYDKNGLLDKTMEQTVFTLNFHDLITDDKYLEFRKARPDSFLLKEESFHLVQKSKIISTIEKSMEYYFNQHNRIAKQFGIKYNFSIPVLDNSQWTRSIDNPGLIITFQGYPFGNGIKGTYNRYAIAGARIKKNTVYYLEQKDWYFLYHKDDCPELEKGGLILDEEPYYTVSECVEKGAYACQYCIKNGAYPPENLIDD